MRNFSPPSAAQQRLFFSFFNGVRWGSWKISGWHALIIRRSLAYITWSKSHLTRESTRGVSDGLILLIFTLSTSERGLAHWRKNGLTLHFRNLLFGWLWSGNPGNRKLKPKPNQIKYNMSCCCFVFFKANNSYFNSSVHIIMAALQ